MFEFYQMAETLASCPLMSYLRYHTTLLIRCARRQDSSPWWQSRALDWLIGSWRGWLRQGIARPGATLSRVAAVKGTRPG